MDQNKSLPPDAGRNVHREELLKAKSMSITADVDTASTNKENTGHRGERMVETPNGLESCGGPVPSPQTKKTPCWRSGDGEESVKQGGGNEKGSQRKQRREKKT